MRETKKVVYGYTTYCSYDNLNDVDFDDLLFVSTEQQAIDEINEYHEDMPDKKAYIVRIELSDLKVVENEEVNTVIED